MDENLTRCPACDNTLKLPPELLGRSVECPKCGHRFVAPLPAGGLPQATRSREDGLTAPGVALLIASLLTGLVNLSSLPSIIMVNGDPAAWDKQIEQQVAAQQKPGMKDDEKEAMQAVLKAFSAENVKVWGNPYCGLSVVTGLLTLVASICMLTRKAYSLAVIGCIAALFPSPCCILQAPMGVWGLIALFGRGKASFH